MAGAQFAQAQGFTTVFMIGNNSEYSQKNVDYFRREASELGLTFVGTVITDQVDNFASLVSNVVAANPDLVYFTSTADQGGPVFREARAAGYMGAFLNQYGVDPQLFAAQAYDAGAICMKAIEEASILKNGEIPTRTEVANAIRALQDYKGITGTYTFNNKGDPTSAKYFVYKVNSVDPNNWSLCSRAENKTFGG